MNKSEKTFIHFFFVGVLWALKMKFKFNKSKEALTFSQRRDSASELNIGTAFHACLL